MNQRKTENIISVLLVSSTFLGHFLSTGFATTIAPVSSLLCERYGCHSTILMGGVISVIGLTVTCVSPNILFVFIFLGVVTGSGFGLVYSSCIFVVNLNITRWRSLCTGISLSGIGLGTTLFPLISNVLIKQYGWRGAILVIAGMVMHICVVAELVWVAQNLSRTVCCLHGTQKTDDVTEKASAFDYQKKSIWKIPKYWALQTNTFLFCFGQSVVFTHIVAFTTFRGHTMIQSSSFISVVGISCLFARIGLSLASHHLHINTEILFIVSYFTAGVATISYCLWSNYLYMLSCMIVLGFCLAAYGPLLTEIVFITMNHNNFCKAYGYLCCFSAIGTLIGAPCAGWIYDLTKEYKISFYCGGASFILSTFPVILLFVYYKYNTNNKYVYQGKSVTEVI